MKKQLFCLLSFFFLISGCGDEAAPQDTNTIPAQPEVIEEETTAQERVERDAICLWDKAGLREGPGRAENIPYVASIGFGEKVTVLGEKEEVAEEKRVYMKVELSDGKSGWVNEYLFAIDAQLAAVTGDIELYKRPDMTTIKEQRLSAGDLIAMKKSEEGWQEVFGFERKKQGWVKGNVKKTVREKDVTTAILLQRALEEETPLEMEKKLKAILNNTALGGSIFLGKVKEVLEASTEMSKLPDNQMYILGNRVNIRATPDAEADNIRFQLNKGTIVNIVEKGAREQIREMDDHWYKIEYQGQKGWIYGGNTSKRLGN